MLKITDRTRFNMFTVCMIIEHKKDFELYITRMETNTETKENMETKKSKDQYCEQKI